MYIFFLGTNFFFSCLLRLLYYASTSSMCPEVIPGSSEYCTFFLFLHIFFLFLYIFLEFWTFFSGNFGQYRHSPHNCDILTVRSILSARQVAVEACVPGKWDHLDMSRGLQSDFSSDSEAAAHCTSNANTRRTLGRPPTSDKPRNMRRRKGSGLERKPVTYLF